MVSVGTYKRVYLLDFDGVLYKNPKAMSYVANRSSAYVHKKMKLVGAAPTHSSDTINKGLYTTYGHTVIGLRKLGYDASTEEYNEFVYDDMPYAAFQDPWLESREWPNHTYVFSNAPSHYCNRITNRKLPNIRDIIGDHITLKPQKKIYDTITRHFDDRTIIHFVDDSMVNFKHTLMNPKWVNTLYVENGNKKRLGDNLMMDNLILI